MSVLPRACSCPLLLFQKPYKGLCDGDAVMGIGYSSHSVGVEFVREDAVAMPPLGDLADDVLGKFGVALDGEVAARGVHGLDSTDVGRAQGNSVGGEGAHLVAMHLLDIL